LGFGSLFECDYIKEIAMRNIILLFILYFTLFTARAQVQQSYADKQQPKGISESVLSDFNNNTVDRLSVYPNPVVDLLKISFRSSQQSNAIITLINNIGKPVLLRESLVDAGNNVVTVDVKGEAINPGIYFVQIVIENNIFTRKLIIK
jgi:hypothetical protein